MPNIIKIKRKTLSGAPLPLELQEGEMCYNLADKVLWIRNADNTLTSLNYVNEFFKVLPADVTSNVTVRSTVADFNFNVTAGKTYVVDFIGCYNTSVVTTGGSLGLTTNGTMTVKGKIEADISASPVSTGLKAPLYAINNVAVTAGSFLTSTGVSAINTPHSFTFTCTLAVTVSGTVNLQWGSEVALTNAVLMAGSLLGVRQIN